MWSEIFKRTQAFPTQEAIVGPRYTYSYSSLLQQATDAALHLQALGLDQQCIGIALKDKEHEVLCSLSVLLSGNYFFFIPHQATRDILDEVPIELLVTDLPELMSLEIIQMSWKDLKNGQGELNHWWEKQDYKKRWFCVYATSGSSDVAKYVLHDYQSVEEDTLRQIEENEINPNDRIDFLFAASFSSSLASIFPTFCAGATLLIQDLERTGLAGIPTFWEKNYVTFTTLTSSAFRSICRLMGNESKRYTHSIRFLCLGGESVIHSDCRLMIEHFPSHALVQLAYASTETRTISSFKFHPCSILNNLHDGFPVRNKTVRILDEEGNECPPCMEGEVVVESEFLSLGYWKNKLLYPHPVQNGLRKYATGDLACWNKDGSIQLLGRAQANRKINGKFVDLNLLEVTITDITEAHCKVIVQRDAAGLEYLVAFVEKNKRWDEQSLRALLANKDNLSIIPRRYIAIDQFPLNSHGKVDRTALENLAQVSIQDFLSDQIKDPTIRIIQRVWSLALGFPITNLNADFFTELGGDSLLAEIVLEDIAQETGKTLPAHLIHDLRSIRQLANFVDQSSEAKLPFLEIWSQQSNLESGWIIMLESGFHNSFEEIKKTLLQSNEVNLGSLRIDLYTVLQTENVENLILSWSKLVEHLGSITWVATSFSGWLAAKLSDHVGGAVVMLDTPSYREDSQRRNQIRSLARLRFLVWLTFKNPNVHTLRKASKLVSNFIGRKFRVKDPPPSLFQQSVSRFVSLGKPVLQVRDLLYIYSLRSLVTSPEDAEDWRSITLGQFVKLDIDGDHMDGCSVDYAMKMAKAIEKFHKQSNQGLFINNEPK
jgi:acyl-coenzyme A synthetase/AMP-(fatty) acid ligase/acyl carrier protein